MDILAVGLAQFVDERMTAVTPDGRDWAEMLQARDAAKHGREKQTDPTDPASPASIRVSANRTEVYWASRRRCDGSADSRTPGRSRLQTRCRRPWRARTT